MDLHSHLIHTHSTSTSRSSSSRGLCLHLIHTHSSSSSSSSSRGLCLHLIHTHSSSSSSSSSTATIIIGSESVSSNSYSHSTNTKTCRRRKNKAACLSPYASPPLAAHAIGKKTCSHNYRGCLLAFLLSADLGAHALLHTFLHLLLENVPPCRSLCTRFVAHRSVSNVGNLSSLQTFVHTCHTLLRIKCWKSLLPADLCAHALLHTFLHLLLEVSPPCRPWCIRVAHCYVSTVGSVKPKLQSAVPRKLPTTNKRDNLLRLFKS